MYMKKAVTASRLFFVYFEETWVGGVKKEGSLDVCHN